MEASLSTAPISNRSRLPETTGTSQASATAAAVKTVSSAKADAFGGSTRAASPLLSPPAGQRLFGGLDLGGIIRGGINAVMGRDSSGLIGWMQKDKSLPPTKDITSDFKSTYEAVKTGGNPLPDEAKDYVYLTVDGLTGENFPGYMEANREGLRDRGLDVREIKVDTEASSLTNAETIKRAIEQVEKEGKKVVLLGHSKGGNDITVALSLYPELKDNVRAVVTMQSPIGGAPLATDLRSNIATKLGVNALAKYVFNGSGDSVRDLTYAWRQDFMEKHPYPTDIPTVSLATEEKSHLSLLDAPNNYVRLRYGEGTDGLVSPKDAFVPGANVITLDDLDHVESTMPTLKQLSKWEPGDLTVSLVAMALKHPPVVPAAQQRAA